MLSPKYYYSHLYTLSIFYWIDNFEEAYEMDVYFMFPH